MDKFIKGPLINIINILNGYNPKSASRNLIGWGSIYVLANGPKQKCKRFYHNWIFTTRKRSCGKVMFSEAFVCSLGEGGLPTGGVLSRREEGVCTGGSIQVVLRRECCEWGAMKKEGAMKEPIPPDQQAGSTHPTGMLSCFRVVSHIEGTMATNRDKPCQPCVLVIFPGELRAKLWATALG